MKKALLAGINKYGGGNDLRGCVNDCLLMHKILTEKYAFPTSDLRLISDKECTKKNIINNLKQLSMDVKAGDTVLFHYSGHGSQVVSDDQQNTTEADGRDEIICPVDLDWNDPFRDHDLGAVFKAIPECVHILVILDCCHSGTGLRNMIKKDLDQYTERDQINRFLPPPPSNILSNPLITLDDDLNFIVPDFDEKDIRTQKNKFVVQTCEQAQTILISGCQDNQTSADAYIGGRYHGALTYVLVKTLIDLNFKPSYIDIIIELNKRMDKYQFEQNPQLEGRENALVLPFLG